MSESDSNQSSKTGFADLEDADIRYYRQLSPEQKLNHLERLVKNLYEMMSPEARENARKLREAGVI